MKFVSLVLALFIKTLNAQELDLIDLFVKSLPPRQECREEAPPSKDCCFSHGDEPLNEICLSGYNLPASVRLKSPYDVFSTISFSIGLLIKREWI